MVKKSKFLKNLLTTASVFAVTLSAGSAVATLKQNIPNQNAVLKGGGNNVTDAANTPNPVAFNDGDDFQFISANQLITTGAQVTIGTINLNGFAAGPFTVAHATTLSGVVDNTGNNKKLATTVNDAVALKLTGNRLDGLGNITLGNAAAGTAKIIIEAENANLKGTINGDAAGKGVVEVNAANVVFSNSVGSTKAIAKLDIKDKKSATLSKAGANNAKDIQIGDGSSLTIGNGVNITSANVHGSAANKGKLKFAGNSTAALTKLGDGNALEVVEAGAGTVDFSTTTDYTAKKTTLNGENSVVKFTKAATVTTDFETSINGKGKVVLSDNTDLVGNIGSDKAALGSVEVAGGKGLFILKDGAKIYAGAITSDTNNASGVLTAGDNIEIHSDIGTNNTKFNVFAITSNGATTVKLMGKSIYATDVGLNNSAVKVIDNILELHDGSNIIGDVATATANSGILSIKGNANIDGAIGEANAINQVKFDTADKVLTVKKNSISANAGIDFAEDGVLVLDEAATLDLTNAAVTVTADENGRGTIKVNNASGGQVVKFGQIGDVAAQDKSLKKLEATGGANIELNGTASIKTINMGNSNSEIRLTKAGAYLIGGLEHTEGKGSLVLSKDATLKSGTDFGNKLNFIQVTDKTLTVEDVDLNTNGIRNSAVGSGSINFKGNSTVTGVIGSNNAFGDIIVEGNEKVVTFEDKLNLDATAKSLTIGKGATAILKDQVSALDIAGANDNEGTIKFHNQNELSGVNAVKAKIGNTKVLNTVELGGADITFNEAGGIFKTQNLVFSSKNQNSLTATFAELKANSLQDTVITTDSTKRNAHIILSDANHALDKAVGSENNKFGNIQITGDKRLDINHADFYAGVTTDADGKGVAAFNAAQNAHVLNIGTEGKALFRTDFDSNITVHEGVYSRDIIVEQNKTVKFKDVVKGSGGIGLGQGASLIFDGENARSDIAIQAKAAGNGTIEFNNTTSISKSIGIAGTRVGTIKFTAAQGKAAAVSANLYGNNIQIGKQTLQPEGDITLGGSSNINGSKIELGSKKITISGGVNSSMNGAISINTIFEDEKIGHFIIDGLGTNLNAANAQISVTIDDKGALPLQDEHYSLFEATNKGTFTLNNLTTVNGSNKFIIWGKDGNELVRKNNAEQAISAIVGSADSTLLSEAKKYANPNNTGDAQAFTKSISTMSSAEAKEAIERIIQNNATRAQNIVESTKEAANQAINNRIGALSNHPMAGKQLASAGQSGVSAGDGCATIEYGAWASPFYSTTTQKSFKGASGFKSDSYGAIVGFDAQVNADLTLGVAGAYAKTDMKHKDLKSGDKTKADTMLFSIYAVQQLTNEWFLQGHTSFSDSKVKNTEKRIVNGTYETANGSFDTTSYTAELLAGYNHTIDNAVITPLIGASFTRINDGGYKETGTTNQNLNVSRKARNKLETVLGIRAQTTTNVDGIDVTPEVHAFAKHDLIAKDAKVTAKHAGLQDQLASTSAKVQRSTFNIGLGVNAVSGMYELGAGYDLNIAEKSLGHQGSLKVRVNF